MALNIIFSVTTLIFSNMGPPTNLLLQVIKDGVLDRVLLVDDACRLKKCFSGHLTAHVHNPPHSSRQPECDWLAPCTYLHESISIPSLN